MNPDVLSDEAHKVLFEMLLPKLMLKFSVKVVLWKVERLNNLYCFDIAEGHLLTCQLVDKKLHVFLTAISNTSIQTTKNWSHGVLSTVSSDVWFELNPSRFVEIASFWKVIKQIRDELRRKRILFCFNKWFVDVKECFSLQTGDVKSIIKLHRKVR